MNTKMTLDFKEIKNDILTAGGKGANLGEMTAAKNHGSGWIRCNRRSLPGLP